MGLNAKVEDSQIGRQPGRNNTRLSSWPRQLLKPFWGLQRKGKARFWPGEPGRNLAEEAVRHKIFAGKTHNRVLSQRMGPPAQVSL